MCMYIFVRIKIYIYILRMRGLGFEPFKLAGLCRLYYLRRPSVRRTCTVHWLPVSFPLSRTAQYNDLSNTVYTFSTDAAPADYQKKVTLLMYFAQYMDEHLIHGGDVHTQGDGNFIKPTGIFMKKWFRTGKAIVMYLNNGTLQVNVPG